MSHLDPDTLTLLALGEEDDGTGGHLASCGTCAADLAALRRTVDAGRAIAPSERAPAPPPQLWDRIAAELDLTPVRVPAPETNGHRATTPAPPRTAPVATPPPAPAAITSAAGADQSTVAPPSAHVPPTAHEPEDAPVAEAPSGPGTPLPDREQQDAPVAEAPSGPGTPLPDSEQQDAPVAEAPSGTGTSPPALAREDAAVSDAAGETGALVAGSEVGRTVAGEAERSVGPKDGRPPVGPRSRARASKRRQASLVSAALLGVLALVAVAAFVLSSARPRVVAEAALAPLEGSSVAGSAQLVERDGALELRLDLDATADTDRYYELWLLDASGDRLVSLGPVAGDGVHPLPAGLTVADFPVVDVSSERFDGDPGHSGDSLSRGTLPV